jgi:hypothetical protein
VESVDGREEAGMSDSVICGCGAAVAVGVVKIPLGPHSGSEE